MGTNPNPFSVSIGDSAGWQTRKVPGRNTAVAQTFVPIAPNGLYRTPQATAPVNLRIRAGGNANDTAAGSGARAIELIGLDAQGREITETLATAGASASAATEQGFIRLIQARVAESGTYATQTAGSHAANIVIEDTGGNLWTTLPVNGFPEGTTRIGAYSLPWNYEGYLLGFWVNVTAQKLVDAIIFQRNALLEVSAPYAPMIAVDELFNISGFRELHYESPIYLPPLTDVGVLAKVDVQTARVNSELQLVLRRVA